MEPLVGVEPTAQRVETSCSNSVELQGHINWGDEWDSNPLTLGPQPSGLPVSLSPP